MLSRRFPGRGAPGGLPGGGGPPMEGYRYQQFAYLIVPLSVGVEFFLTARTERKKAGKESARAVVMDALGYVFAALVPAMFLFTIFSLEYKRYPLMAPLLHRIDRYG